MSVCDEGWEHAYCPARQVDDEWTLYCGLGVFDENHVSPDTCPFAAILKALPGASAEQREAAEAILTVDPEAWKRITKIPVSMPGYDAPLEREGGDE